MKKNIRIILGLLSLSISVYLLISIFEITNSISESNGMLHSTNFKIACVLMIIGLMGVYTTWAIALLKKISTKKIFVPTMLCTSLFTFALGYMIFI